MTIDLACSLPSDTFGTTLIGLQRYDLLNLTVAGTSLAQAVAWIVVIALGGGLIPLGVCLLGFSLIGQFSRYLLARRILGANVLKRRYFDRKLVWPLLSMSGWLAVHEVAATVIGQIDGSVVGIIAGVPQAAVYIVGLKLANLTSSLTSAVQAIFYPEASRLAAAGDHEGLRRTVFTGTRMSMAVAVPISVMLAVLAKPALDAWVGPGYSSAAVVVVYLSGGVVVTSMVGTIVAVLNGMGNVKLPAIFAVVEAGLNLPLSIALGLTIGFQGVALATLIAAFIVIFGLTLPYCCRVAQISMMDLISVVARAHLPPAIAAGCVGLLLVHGGVSGLLQVAAAGAAMLVTYATVLFVTGLSSAERSFVFDRVLPGRAN
jgi:O-antigen/teichoic acid export membrane protein